jgi:hypothetical protein
MSEIIQDKAKSGNDAHILRVNLTNHAKVRLDCSNLWANIEIYESVFQNVITGSITLFDNNNIIRNMPLIGREFLEIVFKTPSSEEISKKFKIYDISMKERIAQKNELIIVLQFSSVQHGMDHSKKISKSFKNQRWHQIARKIFDDYLTRKTGKNTKFTILKDTLPNTSLVIPNWTPFQTLNWISSKMEYYGNIDYLFFESMDGFFLVPLGYFKSKGIKAIYKQDPEPVLEEFNQNPEISRRKILSYFEVLNGNNKSEMEMEGVFASRTFVHDTTFKTVQSKDFLYDLDFRDGNVIKLSENPIAPSVYTLGVNPQNHIEYKQKSSYAFDSVKQQYDPFHTQKRRSQLLRNNAKVMKIEVMGDSSRKLGDVIKLEIPAPEFLPTKDRSKLLDGTISGKYIVTSLSHHLTRLDGYHMAMELMRDSYEEPIADKVTLRP